MPKLIDLSGNIYGRLNVIERDFDYQKRNGLSNKKTYWKCQCSCGNIVSKDAYSLTHGKTQSCGCYQKEIVSKLFFEDLTNQVFGRLTVLKIDEQRPYKRKECYYWICKCSCGNIKSIRSSSLKDGSVQSCGCLQKERVKETIMKDLKGQRFGKLLVLKETSFKKEQRGIVWKCLCDCGNISYVLSSSLISGNTCSCGCLNSKGNMKIKSLLTKNNISFIPEYSFKDLINPETNHILYFDFAIFYNGKLSHLIEYDGAQHFLKKPQGYFSMEMIEKIQKLDSLKNEYCKKNNIPLIRIPYTLYKDLAISHLLLEKKKICPANV